MDAGQKKYILENYKKRPVKELAKELNLKERKITKFLEREKQKRKILEHREEVKEIQTFKTPLALLVIFILGLLVYSNTFHASFQWDDKPHIAESRDIQDLWNPGPIWQKFKQRFITHWSFALNYRLHGLDVTGYHLVNIAIHLLTSVTVFFLIRLTFKTPYLSSHPLRKHAQAIALFASLIFLVHPVQTQAVTYIVQRATCLATLGYLGAIFFYLKARLGHGLFYYVLAMAATVAAMFSKQISFTLPLAIVMYEACFLDGFKKNIKKTLFILTPFSMTMAIIPSLQGLTSTSLGLDRLADIARETAQIPRTTYLFTQFNVLRTYLRLLFFPVEQNLDYDYPIARNLFEPTTLLSFLLLVSLAISALAIYKKQRIIAFAIFWFFLTLSVESSLIPIRDVIFEHRLYLPMFGFSLLLSVGLFLLVKDIPKLFVIFSLLILIFSILTYRRNLVWKDPITLWQDVIRKSPKKARPYNNLGVSYSDQGNVEKEMEYYQKAIQLDPYYAEAVFNLGVAYGKKGDLENEVKNYQKAIEIDPNYVDAYNNLAIFYGQKGDYDQAIEYCQKALKIYPAHGEIHYNLGLAYSKKGNTAGAEEQIRQLRTLRRDDLAEKLKKNIYPSQG